MSKCIKYQALSSDIFDISISRSMGMTRGRAVGLDRSSQDVVAFDINERVLCKEDQ